MCDSSLPLLLRILILSWGRYSSDLMNSQRPQLLTTLLGGVKISAYEIWRDTNMQSLVEP